MPQRRLQQGWSRYKIKFYPPYQPYFHGSQIVSCMQASSNLETTDEGERAVTIRHFLLHRKTCRTTTLRTPSVFDIAAKYDLNFILKKQNHTNANHDKHNPTTNKDNSIVWEYTNSIWCSNMVSIFAMIQQRFPQLH